MYNIHVFGPRHLSGSSVTYVSVFICDGKNHSGLCHLYFISTVDRNSEHPHNRVVRNRTGCLRLHIKSESLLPMLLCQNWISVGKCVGNFNLKAFTFLTETVMHTHAYAHIHEARI